MSWILCKLAVLVLVVTLLFWLFCRLLNAGESNADKLRIALGTYTPWYHVVLAVMVLASFVSLLYIVIYFLFLWR